MSPEELGENSDPQTKRYILRRSIMDIGMGVIYIGVGIVILFANKFRLYNEFAESLWGKIFAGLFILYGSWRVYRGIKKDYLKDR